MTNRQIAISDVMLNNMVELEQRTLRSHKTHECIVSGCNSVGTVKRPSELIKVVSHYWMCEECDEYWRNKN